ncbi:hypothetical protein N505_0102140 [Rhodococcus aetherivorans]|nr:hypothetical protein N505_0102140 [Rhodococcus aetherivorans]
MLRRYRRAILAGEHEPVIGVGTPPPQALDVLSEPLGHEDAGGLLVQVDDPVFAAGGLGAAELELSMLAAAVGAVDAGAVHLDQLLPHGNGLAQ